MDKCDINYVQPQRPKLPHLKCSSIMAPQFLVQSPMPTRSSLEGTYEFISVEEIENIRSKTRSSKARLWVKTIKNQLQLDKSGIIIPFRKNPRNKKTQFSITNTSQRSSCRHVETILMVAFGTFLAITFILVGIGEAVSHNSPASSFENSTVLRNTTTFLSQRSKTTTTRSTIELSHTTNTTMTMYHS